MKKLKLSREEFCNALKKGQGRALLHVQHNGDEGIEDDLRNACLTRAESLLIEATKSDKPARRL